MQETLPDFRYLIVQANHEKLMLGKTEGSITNGQCRDTGEIVHMTQYEEKRQKHKKPKKDPQKRFLVGFVLIDL